MQFTFKRKFQEQIWGKKNMEHTSVLVVKFFGINAWNKAIYVYLCGFNRSYHQ